MTNQEIKKSIKYVQGIDLFTKPYVVLSDGVKGCHIKQLKKKGGAKCQK